MTHVAHSNFTIDVGRANGARCGMGSRTHLKTTLTLSFTFLNTSASTFQPSLHRLWFSNDASCQRASEVCLSRGPTLDVHCSRRGPPHQAKYIFRHAFPLQTWSHVACFWPAVSSGKLNSGAVQMVLPKIIKWTPCQRKWFLRQSHLFLSNKFKPLHHPTF